MKKKIKIIISTLIIVSFLFDIILLIPDKNNNRNGLSSFYTIYSIQTGSITYNTNNGTQTSYPYGGNLIINYTKIAPDEYNVTMKVNLQVDQGSISNINPNQVPNFNSTV